MVYRQRRWKKNLPFVYNRRLNQLLPFISKRREAINTLKHMVALNQMNSLEIAIGMLMLFC
jgi:hypothetical protein